jgi:hypothetical protein
MNPDMIRDDSMHLLLREGRMFAPFDLHPAFDLLACGDRFLHKQE